MNTDATDPTGIDTLQTRVEMLTDVGADTARAIIAMKQELYMFRATFLVGALIFGTILFFQAYGSRPTP